MLEYRRPYFRHLDANCELKWRLRGLHKDIYFFRCDVTSFVGLMIFNSVVFTSEWLLYILQPIFVKGDSSTETTVAGLGDTTMIVTDEHNSGCSGLILFRVDTDPPTRLGPDLTSKEMTVDIGYCLSNSRPCIFMVSKYGHYDSLLHILTVYFCNHTSIYQPISHRLTNRGDYHSPRGSGVFPKAVGTSIVSLQDLGLKYTSNTRNKAGDDCDELDADWMTVFPAIFRNLWYT